MDKFIIALDFFLILIFSMIFFGITPVLAEECVIDSQRQTLCKECDFEKAHGVAYAVGDCRAMCKEWGQSESIANVPYQSYNYIAWNSGLRICNVSSSPKYSIECPPVGAGISECNY